jgi:hypothetical protein
VAEISIRVAKTTGLILACTTRQNHGSSSMANQGVRSMLFTPRFKASTGQSGSEVNVFHAVIQNLGRPITGRVIFWHSLDARICRPDYLYFGLHSDFLLLTNTPATLFFHSQEFKFPV